MQRRTTLGLALAATTLAACGTLGGDAGWVTLIDGARGLENFERVGDANWRAEDGAIVADNGAGGFLVTRRSWRDVQIRAEFWAEATTNSGIFLRAQDPKKIAATSSYEVNIFDQRPDPTYGTGAVVDVARVVPMPKAAGRWNTYEITARGDRLVVVLNGQTTVDVRDAKFAQGPFALQYALGANNIRGGAIKWRKLQAREL